MIKRLDLILNGKGGVGKSFFAVNFVQYLKDRNIEYAACDCDNENSTLKRFHAEVEFFQPRRTARPLIRFLSHWTRPTWWLWIAGQPRPRCFSIILMKLNCGTTLQDLSAALTIIIPVNHETDSVDQLQRLVNKLGDACSYVVLRNEVHDDTFTVYDQSVIRKRLRKELAAKEITMTKLQPFLVEELSLKNMTITSAIKDGELQPVGPPSFAKHGSENFTPKSNQRRNSCCRQNHERTRQTNATRF